MNVVLDTNIYQADFSLKRTEFSVLSSYLDKTDSKLIIPYVVRMEVIQNYKHDLKKGIKSLKASASLFHKCATSEEYKALSRAINSLEVRNNKKFEDEANAYLDFVANRIRNIDLPTKPIVDIDYFLDKALKKEKPFKESGAGFKDAVIWKSIIDYCRNKNLNSIVFISNNSSDFGKKNLETVFIDEALENGITACYYNSLNDFIVDRFNSIDDIKLLPHQIDLGLLQTQIETYLQINTPLLKKFFDRKSSGEETYHDFQGIVELRVVEIQSLIVKDVSTEFKYVQATLACEIDIACVVDRYSEFVNQYSGDFDYDISQDVESLSSSCLIDISLHFEENIFSQLQVLDFDFTA